MSLSDDEYDEIEKLVNETVNNIYLEDEVICDIKPTILEGVVEDACKELLNRQKIKIKIRAGRLDGCIGYAWGDAFVIASHGTQFDLILSSIELSIHSLAHDRDAARRNLKEMLIEFVKDAIEGLRYIQEGIERKTELTLYLG